MWTIANKIIKLGSGLVLAAGLASPAAAITPAVTRPMGVGRSEMVTSGVASRAAADVQIRRLKASLVSKKSESAYDALERLQKQLRGQN